MRCARLLYTLHVNNGEIEVGPDSKKSTRVRPATTGQQPINVKFPYADLRST